jgi:hypothetical protein
MRRSLFPSFIFAVGVLAVSSTAWASRTYPGLLQSATGMPCAPTCTLCHRDMNGGLFTVVKPFGKAMIGAGLIGASPDTLKPAVDQLAKDGTDSDGDGVPDIQELQEGRDPNVAGSGMLCGPTYGCGARIEPSGSLDGYAAVAALATAAALLWRMKKPRVRARKAATSSTGAGR